METLRQTASLDQKRAALKQRLSGFEHLLVAFSGGVDSAYLAWEAQQALGTRMLAVIADSPSLPRAELAAATQFANEHGIALRVMATSELDRPEYARNDASRCYFCKDELFAAMETIRQEFGDSAVAFGMNADEREDLHRPGQQAARMHNVMAPLADAELTKSDIRSLAQRAGLSVWDKPASACLASRIEPGRPVTAEALRQVEEAEAHLHTLGFRQVRVRHHGELARIEIDRSELRDALSLSQLDQISSGIRSLGFRFVTLDCEGYRSGSMNDLHKADNIFVPLASLTEAPVLRDES